MSSDEALNEARRVMTICNACRYCEGFCAVFPAMELRRSFSDEDLKYLANVCHDCRGCYYACQYAPPHQFSLNVPQSLAQLRLESYQDFTWPNILTALFRRNGVAVLLLSGLGLILVLLLTLFSQDASNLLLVHQGPGSFYKVISYEAMVIPFLVLGLILVFVLGIGFLRSLQGMGCRCRELFSLKGHFRSIQNVLLLKYLDGGGHGCNYPGERFSMSRRWLHHMVFYGFLLCLAATTVAAFYEHVLHKVAPYPFLSWPVVLGTLGGLGLCMGSAGLLVLKTITDQRPAEKSGLGLDVGFLVLLLLTGVSGLALLVLRETQAMGMLLIVHLGLVAGLFLTIPYGKFIHALYRYAALLKYAREEAQIRQTAKKG